MASSRKIGRVDESKQTESGDNDALLSDNDSENGDDGTDESENEFMDEVWR